MVLETTITDIDIKKGRVAGNIIVNLLEHGYSQHSKMNIILIISYFAILNLIILSVYFAFQKYEKRITFFICFNFFALAIGIFVNVLLYQKSLILLYIFFPINFLSLYGTPPHFYFIINSLLKNNIRLGKKYFHYSPIAIAFVFFCWYYLQPLNYQKHLLTELITGNDPWQINALNYMFIFQSLYYTVLSYRNIYLAKKTNPDNNNVPWLWRFANYVLLASFILFLAVIYSNSANTIIIISSLIALGFYYGMIYELLKNRPALKIATQLPKVANLSKNDIMLSDIMHEDSEQKLIEVLNQLINIEKIYLISSLTVNQFAHRSKIPRYLLTHYLNHKYNKTFPEFMNYHRIEEAKRLLNEPDSLKYSIEVVVQKCGFKSRSAFYSAFKAQTGLTPLEYIKLIET